jgi:LysR family transcriptional regulator, benzoate and cis,cis-muconate-responsive activator of ben and cat genes
MTLKTDQLRYFVTVAEEGQITRAAKKLYIAQPALSQAIAQLESELGLQLLERHAKGVRLTVAGEAFLEKARAVVETERDVSLTAESLARAARGVVEVGFIGPPPPMTAPAVFTALAHAHPDAEVTFRELPFPRGSTRGWLEDVDVAFCQPPEADDQIEVHHVRVEPRTLIVSVTHPLAGSASARVEQALDETFVSYHPDVQPGWAGFHSLDDHRGAPPASCTEDRISTSLEMLGRLGALSGTEAVTVLPDADAQLVAHVLANVTAVRLADAEPATVSLVWHAGDAHPLVRALVESAAAAQEELASGA